MREQKANDNGFPVVGKQVKEQQIFPFDQLVKYDGAANKITINANVTINGDTNIGELDIDSGDAPKGQVLTADGDSGASWENRFAYLNLESESGNLTNAQIEVAEQDNVIITLDGQFYYKNSQSDEAIVFKAPAKVVNDDTIVEKVVIDLSDNTYSYSYEIVATGGSFDPVYDDELNDSSTNAVQNKVIYEALNEKADTEKIENGEIVAGKSQVAESLETEVGKLDQTPFSYMSSGGQTDIESGIQRSIKLVGVNLVKNQYVQDIGSTTTVNGITYTKNADKSWTVSGTATARATGPNVGTSFDIIKDHYYLSVSGQNVSLHSSDWQTNTSQAGFSIDKATTSRPNNLGFDVISPDGTYPYEIPTQTFFPLVCDLTKRYGSNEVVEAIIGNDTSKQVERLLQFDSNILKDISFDTGSMLTVKTALLKSTGYNVWDEQYTIAGGTQLKSKNLIRVKSGAIYYAYCGTNASAYLAPNFYDINGNYIGTTNSVHNSTFTVPVNCAYIEFYMNSAYGTTYNNDICIFEYWDGSRIGYEPSEEKTETMPNVELNGILKVDASGNVYADGDELYPDNTQNKKRYGVISGSQLTFMRITTQGMNLYRFVGAKYNSYNMINTACIPVVSSFNSDAETEEKIQFATETAEGNAYVLLKADRDLTSFVIYYALNEEQPLVANSYNPNLWADDFGHLQFLDENGNEINGLQGCEIFYKANISGFAESLYVRAEGEPENVVVQREISDSALAERGYLKLASLSGYDETKTQTLKNIEGVFTWVDDE